MARNRFGSIPLPWLRWRGLNLQFLALIFLPLTAILLLITFGSLTLHQRAMRNLVGERDERAARTAAIALSGQLNYRAAAIRGLAIRASEQIPAPEILASSQYLLPDFDYGIALFVLEGEALAYLGDEGLWESPPENLRDLLADAQEAGAQAVFSAPVLYPLRDDWLIFVAFAAEKDRPIAIGAFSPEALARRILVGAYAPGEQSTAFVVTQDKQVIYQVGDFSSPDISSDHPGVAEALRGEGGTTYLDVNGSEHVIAFSPILPTGWALVIEEPWEAVTNPLLNTTQLAPLVLVPVLLLALVALWFGARQIVGPLQELEARASDLAWGKYQTIEEPVGGIEEIQSLQQTLIHLAGKIQRAQEGLRGYIGAITSGQEEERRRLARELHDDTIQDLIALNQRVQLARLKLADDAQMGGFLDEVQSMTEETIRDLRRLIRALRPPYMEDLGLSAALEMLARETSAVHQLSVEFQRVGVERRLPPETELSLFRMAQEGLNNVLHHAQAQHAWVKLCFADAEVSLKIRDDGRGFEVPESPAEFAPGGHYGLLGMHERAELIGARLEIQSKLGSGTELTLMFFFG